MTLLSVSEIQCTLSVLERIRNIREVSVPRGSTIILKIPVDTLWYIPLFLYSCKIGFSIYLDQARINLICPECSTTMTKNHRSHTCSVYDLTYHIKCGNATPNDFTLIQRIVPMIRKCPICLHDISFDLNELYHLLLCPKNLSIVWWQRIHFTTNLHNAILILNEPF